MNVPMMMLLLQGSPQCALVEYVPHVPLVVVAAAALATEPQSFLLVVRGQAYVCQCK